MSWPTGIFSGSGSCGTKYDVGNAVARSRRGLNAVDADPRHRGRDAPGAGSGSQRRLVGTVGADQRDALASGPPRGKCRPAPALPEGLADILWWIIYRLLLCVVAGITGVRGPGCLLATGHLTSGSTNRSGTRPAGRSVCSPGGDATSGLDRAALDDGFEHVRHQADLAAVALVETALQLVRCAPATGCRPPRRSGRSGRRSGTARREEEDLEHGRATTHSGDRRRRRSARATGYPSVRWPRTRCSRSPRRTARTRSNLRCAGGGRRLVGDQLLLGQVQVDLLRPAR